jgi:hypothetical protein
VPTSSENQRGNAEKNYNHVLLIKKMFIIYLSLVLMETKSYLRKQNLIKEEMSKKKKFGIKNKECRSMDILEVNEIDIDAKVLYCNSLCTKFRCS